MRLPRWLLVLLIVVSVLAPLLAAGWWWVTWPDRTMREYVALVAEGNFDPYVMLHDVVAARGLNRFDAGP